LLASLTRPSGRQDGPLPSFLSVLANFFFSFFGRSGAAALPFFPLRRERSAGSPQRGARPQTPLSLVRVRRLPLLSREYTGDSFSFFLPGSMDDLRLVGRLAPWFFVFPRLRRDVSFFSAVYVDLSDRLGFLPTRAFPLSHYGYFFFTEMRAPFFP